jgi:general secretion pathway protein G
MSTGFSPLSTSSTDSSGAGASSKASDAASPRAFPASASSKPEWLAHVFRWRGRITGACLFLAGLGCGVAAMKMFAPKYSSPQSASAALNAAGPSGASTTNPADSASAQPSKPAVSIQTVTPPANTAKPTPPEPPETEEELAARKSSLISTLLTLRSQIDLFKTQHNGRVPDLAAHPQWGQLTRRTRVDGTPATDGSFGPYIMAAPTNPLNGFATVGLLKKVPAAGEVVKSDKLGFVYGMVSGELVATDKDGKTIFDDQAARAEAGDSKGAKTQASPSHASAPAKAAAPRPSPQETKQRSAVAQLNKLRTLIEQYRAQHDKENPDFVRYDNWEQFTRRTTVDGAFASPSDKVVHGPYLTAVPANPVNGYSVVESVGKLSTYTPKGKKIGYVFESSSGQLFATDERGGILRD